MPGKSRHGKGKRFHSKKSKAMIRQGTAPATAAAGATAPEAPRPEAPATTATAPRAAVAAAKANVNPYPFIGSELRRIALLAGIIIVVLVVLSITLS